MTPEHLTYEQLDEVQRFATSLVYLAGARLRDSFRKAGSPTEIAKGGVDFTTSADMESETILKRLERRYPGIPILSEETAPDQYSHFRDAEQLWVIDPLDGTTNFSRKRDHFAISAALVRFGIPMLAIAYLPMQDELYTATRITPTLLNGRPINVSRTAGLSQAWIESGISWDMNARRRFTETWIPSLVQHVRAFTMSGSTVFDMAKVAQGQVDGFVYCGNKPWDQAAPGLLIEKAGGTITTANGEPWNVFEPDIVASNGHIHQQLLELLRND